MILQEWPALTAPLLVIASNTACAGASAPRLMTIEPSQVCVESGRLDTESTGLSVRTAGMRAVVAHTTGDAVAVAFTYRGPTGAQVALGSGEMRQQIGLKLRAHDTCNVVYVTWQIAPRQGVYASVKVNPGQRTHEECRDRGYVSIEPSWTSELSPIQLGAPRTLGARIEGHDLRVLVDGHPVWVGTLPPEAFTFDGPVGVRSDNSALDFDILAVPGGQGCAHPAGDPFPHPKPTSPPNRSQS